MKRRTFLGQGGAATIGASALLARRASAQTAGHPLWPLWQAWRRAHLDFSGRVIDGLQNRASHSEGQGYGMVLAAEFGDEDAFRRMVAWTEANLAIRMDNLLAWRWRPDLPERVTDLNNASDGDLFYAWALLRGADRFGDARWRDRAAGIAADLVRKCLMARPDRPDRLILLPAEHGFVSGGQAVVNPSYMMPRALREVAAATGQGGLAQAAEAGLEMMREIAATRLVPDWVRIDATGLSEARGFSSDAGYEAIRVPLFLAWSGEIDHPALRRAAQALAQAPLGQAATVLDARTGAILAWSSEPGYQAVSALLNCAVRGGMGAAIPPFRSSQAYYPATLHLFCLITQRRHIPRCVPI